MSFGAILVVGWGVAFASATSPNLTVAWPWSGSTDIIPDSCTAECGSQKLAQDLKTLVNDLEDKFKFDSFQAFEANVGPFVEELFTGVQNLFCEATDVAQCMLNNAAKCASGGKWQSWSDLTDAFSVIA